LLVSAALVTARGAPATAATPLTMYQLVNVRSLSCLQQNGVSDAVYAGTCGANHSAMWTKTWKGSGFWLVNVHSGQCVSVAGSAVGSPIHMTLCNPSLPLDQQWNASTGLPPQKGDFINTLVWMWNADSKLCLWQGNPSASAVVQSTCASSTDEPRDLWVLNEVP